MTCGVASSYSYHSQHDRTLGFAKKGKQVSSITMVCRGGDRETLFLGQVLEELQTELEEGTPQKIIPISRMWIPPNRPNNAASLLTPDTTPPDRSLEP